MSKCGETFLASSETVAFWRGSLPYYYSVYNILLFLSENRNRMAHTVTELSDYRGSIPGGCARYWSLLQNVRIGSWTHPEPLFTMSVHSPIYVRDVYKDSFVFTFRHFAQITIIIRWFSSDPVSSKEYKLECKMHIGFAPCCCSVITVDFSAIFYMLLTVHLFTNSMK